MNNLLEKKIENLENNKKFYVTTPIYYVTAKPHIGNLYPSILADVVARWNKLQGKKTFFLTGTDEHGQKVAKAAHNAGKDPKEFVDSFIPAFKSIFKDYEIDYDYFIRTTDPAHEQAVQAWLKMLLDKGEIYKSNYEGFYCVHCELFVKPSCAKATEGMLGGEQDQAICQASSLCQGYDGLAQDDRQEIVLCPDCGRETEIVSEECYFFRLSKYQDKLLKFYEENPDIIAPKERLNEVISFLKSGLKDLSISRTKITWGIPFPGDDKHVTYVWADALNNYITAVGWGQGEKPENTSKNGLGKQSPEVLEKELQGLPVNTKEFDFWWPADLHIMGKDILRFHAIYWPAFLMASGLKLPKRMLVTGWITVDKKKMSKSFGNVLDPVALRELYGAEPMRYYLVRQMAINQDGDFSTEDLEQRISSDLANDLGNLLNRMVALAEKNGVVELSAPKTWSEGAVELRDLAQNTISDFQTYMADYQFHMALASLWKFINKVNSYFHTQEPWKLAKTDKDKFLEVLSATGHGLEIIATLLWPVMPRKMEQLLGSLGLSFPSINSGRTGEKNFVGHAGGENLIEKLSLGHWDKKFVLHKTDTLFVKPEPMDPSLNSLLRQGYEGHAGRTGEGVGVVDGGSSKQESVNVKGNIVSETGKVGENVSVMGQTSLELEQISIEEFAKMHMVVGQVETAEEVAGSDKLLKLIVDCGAYGKRQVFSGVRKYYKPEELVGKQGIFVVNLKPRKIMGQESQGMMLFAQDEAGNFKFTTVSGFVANGTRLK